MTTPTRNRAAPARRRRRRLLFFGGLLLMSGAFAAVIFAGLRNTDFSGITPQDFPKNVGMDQKLDAQVPLDIRLRDEAGNSVPLEDFFTGKPVVLTLVYYECPMLCKMTRAGQLRSLKELSLSAGADFTALTVSIDPRERPELAAAAKETTLRTYERPGAEQGWRFLTGEEPEIRRLTDAVGFRYKYDPKTGQYAHPAGLIVLTPEGKVSRYLYGVDFPPRDLRLALIEASGGKIGSPTDHVLLMCFHYDPTTGRYGLAIMNVLRLAGVLTVAGIGTAITALIRRERQQRSAGLPSYENDE